MAKKRTDLLNAGGPSFDIPGKNTTGLGSMKPGDVERLKKGNPGAAGKIDKEVQQIRQGINLPLAKKNKRTKPLTEKSDKPYGQPEKAKKKKKKRKTYIA